MRPISRVPLRSLALAFVLCISAVAFYDGGTAWVWAQTATRQAGLESLVVTTRSGAHRFDVEVMRSEAERERGLMFRRFLPADRGMLFDFRTEQPVMMWMKNTYLPLDMIFIGRDGTVRNIAQNAEPMSERIIPSGAPVYAVLEVNAGTAARIDLAVGDHVQQKLFGN